MSTALYIIYIILCVCFIALVAMQEAKGALKQAPVHSTYNFNSKEKVLRKITTIAAIVIFACTIGLLIAKV